MCRRCPYAMYAAAAAATRAFILYIHTHTRRHKNGRSVLFAGANVMRCANHTQTRTHARTYRLQPPARLPKRRLCVPVRLFPHAHCTFRECAVFCARSACVRGASSRIMIVIILRPSVAVTRARMHARTHTPYKKGEQFLTVGNVRLSAIVCATAVPFVPCGVRPFNSRTRNKSTCAAPCVIYGAAACKFAINSADPGCAVFNAHSACPSMRVNWM